MNTINSTIYGKAYEYACILAIKDIVSKYRRIEIENNESLAIAKDRYKNGISTQDRQEMQLSAKSGIIAIIEMEPRIIEDGKDVLSVSLQPDNVATKNGDIRDVLIIRRSIKWEIGISVKHNHSALKHSRLSPHLDFGQEWMNHPCSKQYFAEIKTTFDKLQKLKEQNKNWRDLSKKEDNVYVPILKAFAKELLSLNKSKSITGNLIKYLIASNGKDYYKLIHNNNHTTTIMPFNISGTLNKSANKISPQIKIPKIKLPTRIIELGFKEKSKTTLILTMDNGWSISFRIHNASTKVETSLKFDIQLQSKPEDIFYLNRKW